MTAPARRTRQRVTLHFAGVIVEGHPAMSIEEAQRIVTERLVRVAARQVPPVAPIGEGEAAD